MLRLEIAEVLRRLKRDALQDALIARLGSDPKSRVRIVLAGAVADLRGPKALEALREAIAKDPSYFVVAEAIRGLGRTAGKDSHADAIAALSRDSHLEVIRAAAIDALVADETVAGDARTEIMRRLTSLLAADQPRAVRGPALRALGRFGKGDDRSFAAVSSALDDPVLFIRLDAVEALATLGDRRAIPLLEARRAKEKRIVLRDPTEAINAAIARIEGQTDMKALQDELRRLRDSNRRLEDRVKGLEQRGPRAERL